MRNLFSKQRNPSVTNRNIRRQFSVSPEVKNRLYGVLGIFAAILLFIGFIYTRNFLKRFTIQEVELVGYSEGNQSELKSFLQQYSGRGILSVSSKKVRKDLNLRFPNFDYFSVKKQWPNKLLISFRENEPEYILSNLSGVYLLSDDGQIISIVSNNKPSLSQEELSIIQGQARLDSPIVKEELLPIKKNKNRNKRNQEFKSISSTIKAQTLSKIEKDLLKSSTTFLNQNALKAQEKLPYHATTLLSYSSKAYSPGQKVPSKAIYTINQVRNRFERLGIKISTIVYKNEYSIEFQTKAATIKFGLHREVEDQLLDYVTIIDILKKNGENYNYIDLSSSKISVR